MTMQILHILPDVREVGNGIVNATVDLACEQSRLGHGVSIASAGGEFEGLLAAHHVEHVSFGVSRSPSRLLAVRRRLGTVIDSIRPDVIHAHTVTTALTVRASRLMTRPPLVTTVHNEFNRSASLMAVGDLVIAPSQAVAARLRRRHVPRHKIRVVLNGTLGSPRTVGHQATIPASLCRPAVVTVAGMYKRKGISDLIDAFAQVASELPSSHLYIVGEGPDRAEFEAQARATGIAERIHFTGYQRDTYQYLLAADLFVLASRREPFGLVLAEAREADCAILASDADGIPEVLDMGRAGCLFPAGDCKALACNIKMFLTDDDYRRSWQRAAGQNIEWLRTDRVAQDTLTVYDELVGST
jgi:glycosyltransferase involved in cell wall biosynthesis